jgi:hypothetical protein
LPDVIGHKIGQGVLRRVPLDHQPTMGRRDQECQHAEVATVGEQWQEPSIEARERPDAQDDGEHQECAASGGTDPDVDRVGKVVRGMNPPGDGGETAEESHDARRENRIVDQLVAVPLHRTEARAHGLPPVAAGGSGGGRNASAIVRPSAIAIGSAGQIRR